METVATGVIEEAERRYKCFVQNPALDPYLQHRRWVLGPGRLKGQTGYDFIATGRGAMEGVRVIWGSGKASTAPSARRFKLFIESAVLWRHYANQGSAYTAATEIIEWITGDLWSAVPDFKEIAVRRLDVCIDHKGYRWQKRDLDRFACRQRVEGVEEEHKPEKVDSRGDPSSATYYIGTRGSASRYLRIYNKIAESLKSGKMPWMRPIWEKQLGWDGKETIWRVEVEFGGEWLRAHGFTDLTKLKGCEHAVWLDYLADVRHTTGTRSRSKRSPTSRMWLCIAAAARRAARGGERCEWTWKPRDPRAGGDMKQLSAMLGGCGRKIRDAMFTDPTKRDQLLAFIAEAIDLSETRHRERQAKLTRHNPRPPPPPRKTA